MLIFNLQYKEIFNQHIKTQTKGTKITILPKHQTSITFTQEFKHSERKITTLKFYNVVF